MWVKKLLLDKKKRLLIVQAELQQLFIKFLFLWLIKIKNNSISSGECNKYLWNLNSGFSSLKAICLLSGRTRSVYKLFRLSRIKIHDLVSDGWLFGFRKSSW